MLFDLREGPEVPPLIAAFRMSYVSRNPLRSLRGHRLAFLELAGAQKPCGSGCEYPSLMAVFPMGYFSRSPPWEGYGVNRFDFIWARRSSADLRIWMRTPAAKDGIPMGLLAEEPIEKFTWPTGLILLRLGGVPQICGSACECPPLTAAFRIGYFMRSPSRRSRD